MKRPCVEPAAARSDFQFQNAPVAGIGQQSTPSPDKPPSLETGDSRNPIILEETSCPASTVISPTPISSVGVAEQKRKHATRYQRSQTVSIQNQSEYCVKNEDPQKADNSMEDGTENFTDNPEFDTMLFS